MIIKEDNAREFTDEQLQFALKRISKQAQEEAFAAGLSISYIESGRLKALFPDGHVEDRGPAHQPVAAGE